MKKPIIALMADGVSPITIGMHCSSGFNGDSYPYEVIAIDSATKIIVRCMNYEPDPACKEAPGVCFAENPDNFIYSSNPTGSLRVVRKHKKLGRDKTTWYSYWKLESGFNVHFGKACFTRNPSF